MRGVNGLALVGIGLLHSLALIIPGAIGFSGIWSEIAQAGVVDAVSSSSLRIWGYYWFLMPGFALIILGLVCAWVERSLKRTVPAFVGWSVLLFSVFGIVLDVDTGFWLVLVVGISLTIAAWRDSAQTGGRTGNTQTV